MAIQKNKLILLVSFQYLLILVFGHYNILFAADNIPTLFARLPETIAIQSTPLIIPDRINIKINLSLIDPSAAVNGPMRVMLPYGEILIIKDHIDMSGQNSYSWFGKVVGDSASLVTIMVNNGSATGNIYINGANYNFETYRTAGTNAGQ